MVLRRSQFVFLLPVSDTITLALHAITQLRMTVTEEIVRLIGWFETPQKLDAVVPALAACFGHEAQAISGCLALLTERGILTELDAEAERAAVAERLAPVHGRDPEAALDRWRQACVEGSHPYWSVAAPQAIEPARAKRRRLDILLFGDCDVQMEADFLRQAAAERGIDMRVAASFVSDSELAGERRHDAIVIGALQARHAIVLGEPEHHGGDPAQVYVDAARKLILDLRSRTTAPILLDALPVPTVQPLGYADRGRYSHRNRFRLTNLALEALAEELPDVHILDVTAALGEAGSTALLDDGLVSFTHFGAPGWMLQRPSAELAAVHGIFPDLTDLARAVGADPYGRERVMARAHLDLLSVVLGLDRRKCVIIDLDGVLWPGVLAETGSPFAWSPEISGPNSYVGLYFGIHEALRALRRRGILLACVSKNDEATVRRLWHYPEHYPQARLLTLDSFITTRINWQDKAENITSIADELGFALDAFLFVDDSARERERVRSSLPEVAVLGEDLFALRRQLLTDPRLQAVAISAESAQRETLVRAQLDRARQLRSADSEDDFIASLDVTCSVAALTRANADTATLARVSELFERTTQFNATGRRFPPADLQVLLVSGQVFTLHMQDRLAHHGLVGAAVILDGEILNFALSCRVIGLRGERALLAAITAASPATLRARIIATERNHPVRHLYRDHGFTDAGDGWWTRQGAAGS